MTWDTAEPCDDVLEVYGREIAVCERFADHDGAHEGGGYRWSDCFEETEDPGAIREWLTELAIEERLLNRRRAS